MNIAIIDAELISNDKHRFPNLACMKLSAWHKAQGDTVTLVTRYFNLKFFFYDTIYISKVFTSTIVPDYVLKMPNVIIGGTGFFYDKAPMLDMAIEHSKPDYDLYNYWVDTMLHSGSDPNDFKYFTDYSIGFTTRGCIRGCSFCVNQNSREVVAWSKASEFVDTNKRGICLLDDNVLMFKDWRSIFEDLKQTGIPFEYKQGMDERALTPDKISMLLSVKYLNDFIFAFDNIHDRPIIERNLEMWRSMDNYSKRLKFYVLCGYDATGTYDDAFWIKDIHDMFLRIAILAKYKAIPYIMRYESSYTSSFADIYTLIAGWCNQPSLFKNMSLNEYSIKKGISNKVYEKYKNNSEQYLVDGCTKGKPWRTLEKLQSLPVDSIDTYLNMHF